jgi:hypothetical protein
VEKVERAERSCPCGDGIEGNAGNGRQYTRNKDPEVKMGSGSDAHKSA